MVRMLESLETFPNVGKPANVIIVDSPEVAREIRELYPADHPIFVKPDNNLFGLGQGMWWYRYGKPGPVVVAETPEAEEAVRELYPSGSTLFVRPKDLPGLGEDKTPTFKASTWPLALITVGVGTLMAVSGFVSRTKPLGSMVMGAGASMVGTSVVLLLRDLVD